MISCCLHIIHNEAVVEIWRIWYAPDLQKVPGLFTHIFYEIQQTRQKFSKPRLFLGQSDLSGVKPNSGLKFNIVFNAHQQHVGRTTDKIIYIITVRYIAMNQLQTEHIRFHILKCTLTCSNRKSRSNSWVLESPTLNGGGGVFHFCGPTRAFHIFSTDITPPLTSIPPVMFVGTYFAMAMWVRMVNTPRLDAESASTVPVLICVHKR